MGNEGLIIFFLTKPLRKITMGAIDASANFKTSAVSLCSLTDKAGKNLMNYE